MQQDERETEGARQIWRAVLVEDGREWHDYGQESMRCDAKHRHDFAAAGFHQLQDDILDSEKRHTVRRNCIQKILFIQR